MTTRNWIIAAIAAIAVVVIIIAGYFVLRPAAETPTSAASYRLGTTAPSGYGTRRQVAACTYSRDT